MENISINTDIKAEKQSENEKLELIFYRNLRQIQWDGLGSEAWKEYQHPIQVFLNKKYKEYLNGKDADVRLIPPHENYRVNLEGHLEIDINNEDSMRFIKIEKRPADITDNNFSYSDLQKERNRIRDTFIDIVFLFGNSSQMPKAKECYSTCMKNFRNQKISFFNDLQQLKNQLQQNNETFLVTSTTDFQLLTHEGLHINKKVIAIYIFRDNQTEIEVEHKSNQNIQIITSSFDILTEKLSHELNSKRMKLFDKNVPIKAGVHFDCNEACIKYFYNQVIFNLFKSNRLSEQQSKDAFINYCINNYSDYGGIQEELEELIENVIDNKFKQEKVIHWYTRDTFFHHLLNGVLRKDNMIDLFKIRYAINQLRDALSKYQYKEQRDFSVFMASLINKSELALFDEKVNGDFNIIQFVGFISTTMSNEEADHFGAMNWVNKKENQYSIMYKLKVDKISCQSLYDINSVSAVPKEEELLLNYDSFIKIDSVEKSDVKLFDYIVNCSISDFKEIHIKVDPKTLEITSHFNLNEKNYKIDDFYLAYLFSENGKDKELINLLNHIKPSDKIQESTKYHFLGVVYIYQGKYDEALRYLFKCLEIREATLGKNHPDIAGSYSNIGLVYDNQKKYDEALNYYFKSTEIYEATLGKNHPDTAGSYNSIGAVYAYQGKYDEALKYYYISLEYREATLGKNHPDTARNYNDIGAVYHNQGKYDEALKYYLKSLEIYEATIGMSHPDTARGYSNIGLVYDNHGKYDEALKYYLKSLEIYEATLGKNHPDTATSYSNIGLVYDNQGKYDEALKYLFKSLKIREATLEKNHPDNAGSYSNIGLVYDNQGKYDEALKCYFKSLEIYEATIGKKHPNTATSYNNIGAVYIYQGKFDEALNYLFKCLEIQEATLGKNHQDTSRSYNNIGIVYHNQGKYDEALKYLFKSLEIRAATLCKNHPDTATSYNNIGAVYKNQGKYDEALKYYFNTLKIREANLGKNHPDTVATYKIISELKKKLNVSC